MKVTPAGDGAWLVDVDDHPQAVVLADAWRGRPGVDDVIVGWSTVLVVGDPLRLGDPPPLQPTTTGTGGPDPRSVVIPVVYDGEDLAEVAALTGLSEVEVAGRHSSARYTVAFCGFAPGFAYLSGGDPALNVPRRPEPRSHVRAGSVGLAGAMTAVYPSDGPGGWQLIGRTSLQLFDPRRPQPALLRAGDTVRFRAVHDLAPAPRPEPRPLPAGDPAGSWLEVLRPGPRTTVQDGGRTGWAHLGVPRSGALDPVALARANTAAGNDPGAAGLECTLAGPTLAAHGPVTVAVAGGDAGLAVNSRPAGPGPVTVNDGDTVSIPALRRGLRCYLAVGGGVDADVVLDSRSTDTLSGLGPLPLRAGDRLPVGSGSPPPNRGEWWRRAAPADDGGPVRVVPGPRLDRFPAATLEEFCRVGWTVDVRSDRVGLRLDGPSIATAGGDLPSEGMATGSVQVPPGGRPVVLLADHGTTGGYAVLAVVATADLGRLAQARPGSTLHFTPVDAARARRLLAPAGDPERGP